MAGRWQPRDSLFIGVIGSDSFTTSDGNGVSIPSTDRARKVVDLGLGEWNAALPDGVTASGSSLAVIHCNANREAAQAARALEHLAAIGVPAVIALGDVERDAIADAARARGIPVLCALCTERARNAAGAEVEAWRMQPPLEEQAPLAADRAAQLEQQLRTDRALADDVPIRIALVGQDSPAHRAFVDNVSSRLRFNGGLTVEGQSEGNFWQRTLSDPRRRGVDALQTSSELIAFRPDIVIASMESEVASLYLTMVEGDWPVDQPRPHYVVTAQNRELDFLQALDRYAMDLPPRLSGTAPLVSTEVARNRTDVTARFVRDNREPPGETQGAYDALYVAAYALYAADLEPSFGIDFVTGLLRLTSGPRIDANPDVILSGGNYLLDGASIDLVGSSSELDWDLSSGGISADATLWCLGRDASGQLVVHDDAGRHWDRTTGEASGSYACPPSP